MPSGSPPWLPPTLHLVSDHDSVARSKCIATTFLKEGSRIFAEESFVNVLLTQEKGERCDACFRLPSKDNQLKKCSGCGSFWYCNVQCMSHTILYSLRAVCRLTFRSKFALGTKSQADLSTLQLVRGFCIIPNPPRK